MCVCLSFVDEGRPSGGAGVGGAFCFFCGSTLVYEHNAQRQHQYTYESTKVGMCGIIYHRTGGDESAYRTS